MADNKTVKALCVQGKANKVKADVFYDKLRNFADEDDTDGDLTCLIEDVLMELEMFYDREGSAKQMNAAVKEAAERILDEFGF